jgi:DNA polymerase-3 subunit delta
LFLFPKLEAATLKTSHVTRLIESLVFLPIWPLSREEFSAWVKQRLTRAKIPVEAALVDALAALTEGNLLSCKQMIDRLSLLPLASLEERLAALHDDARFTGYDWTESIACGETPRALRALAHLQAEGSELSLLLWSIAQELRLALLAKESQDSFANFCEKHRIWPKRRPAFKQFLSRMSKPRLADALLTCANIDKVIKGAIKSDPWQLLRELTLSLVR